MTSDQKIVQSGSDGSSGANTDGSGGVDKLDAAIGTPVTGESEPGRELEIAATSVSVSTPGVVPTKKKKKPKDGASVEGSDPSQGVALVASPVTTATKRKKGGGSGVAVAGTTSFFKSRSSQFSDGYDLERERLAVLPLITKAAAGAEVSPSDPMFERYVEYLDRARAHQKLSVERQQKQSEQSIVTRREAVAYRNLGALINADDDQDSITLHTREALQLFIGRAADPDNPKAPRIISFKKVGAAYRLLWSLSSNNNPYADWALIGLSRKRDALHEMLVADVGQLTESIAEIGRTRGIHISIGVNKTPQEMPIKFKSPYGYALVMTLAEFDYYVRIVKTLAHKGRITQALGETLVKKVMREFRAHFNEVKYFEKFLTDADLLLLTRSDFLPTADDVARGRIAKCLAMFGEVPRSVFMFEDVPPYKSNRVVMTDAEVELLSKVTQGVMDEEDAAEAAAVEAGAKNLV